MKKKKSSKKKVCKFSKALSIFGEKKITSVYQMKIIMALGDAPDSRAKDLAVFVHGKVVDATENKVLLQNIRSYLTFMESGDRTKSRSALIQKVQLRRPKKESGPFCYLYSLTPETQKIYARVCKVMGD